MQSVVKYTDKYKKLKLTQKNNNYTLINIFEFEL